MIDESSDHFFFSEVEPKDFRNETEREFLTALFAHASEWESLGVTDDCCMIHYGASILMVAFDICDWSGGNVVRSLKVDFNGKGVLMGETGTNLFDTAFEADDSSIKEFRESGASPTDSAEAAAKWLYSEMSRPIILKEWITWRSHRREYKTLDSVQSITDSQIKKSYYPGSPTRAAIVHPKNMRKTLFF